LQGIETRVRAPKPKPVPQGGAALLRIGLIVAAACLAALLFTRLYWPAPVKPPPREDEEPYPVASADEITIISMDPRDSRSLVVGLPPIGGDMEWATMEDVSLLDTKPNNGGQMPDMHTAGTVPVIVPMTGWGGKED
jgi:hypothetical protein